MSDPRLARLDVTRQTGREPFTKDGEPIGTTLLDLWQWSNSDLMGNTLRCVLAEYIVARAIGDEGEVRDPWAAYDLTSREGVKVEVKATCEVQSWFQKQPSKPKFTIRPARFWTEETGMSDNVGRHADLYVFCVLLVPESGLPDPLDVGHWAFYVVRTATLDAWSPTAKTVGLSTIRRLDHERVGFDDLGPAVQRLGALA